MHHPLASARLTPSVRLSWLQVVFYESFEEPIEGRWIVSESSDYQGEWKREKSLGHDDYGLLVPEKAKKYAIAAVLPEKVDPKVDTVVLQYDLRLQGGLECGGAYLKFLMDQARPHSTDCDASGLMLLAYLEAGWNPSQFSNESPYSIMFGPDKCGGTNKVHFIFRHKNPRTGKYVEHHLKNPPTPVTDKLSHVYTAVLHANNTLKLMIDGVGKKTVNILSDHFDPPIVPPKEISDPDDKKPADWDDKERIPDPDAMKPDDWDEDAPRQVEDTDAVKPEGWLDDEPLEIDDPEATKPDDWDDEEDGTWEPNKITNPKCTQGPGCGEWTRPTKKNPAYKGKWSAPLVENPNYQGVWAPRKIDNPEWFELERPDLESIAAVGIEIWTMNDGMLFDNILVTHDEDVANEYVETAWRPKYDAEKKLKDDEEAKEASKSKTPSGNNWEAKMFEILHKIPKIPFLKPFAKNLEAIIEQGEDYPLATAAVLGLIFTTFVVLLYNLTSLIPLLPVKKGTKKVTLEQAKKEDLSTSDDVVEEEEKELEQQVEDIAAAAEDAAAEKDAATTDGAAAVTDEIVMEEESVGMATRRRTRRDT
eukprot:SM000066S20468  [mRNA]  locus=s66:567993:571870:+ [translate_table: standard]